MTEHKPTPGRNGRSTARDWGADFRSRRAVGCGLCLAALALGCGRTENTQPPFRQKRCGEVSEVIEPPSSLGRIEASLKGVAFVRSTGKLGLTPVIDVDDAAIVPIDPERLTLEASVPAVSDTLAPISPDNPAAADVVFIVDTTKYMSWVIEGTTRGARNLRDLVTPAGVDVQFGGIEFGDEVRTRVDVGSLEALQSWLASLVPMGGGDDPNSALDAILEVDRTFSFRPNAVRYWVVISATGYHESADGSGCSEVSLAQLQDRMRPDTLLTLVRVGVDVDRGLRPDQVAETLGALSVDRGVFAVLGFNVAEHIPLVELLTAGVSGDIEAPGDTDALGSIGVRYEFGSTSVTTSLEVQH